MGAPSLTARLRRAAFTHGQEIVAEGPGGQLVLVAYSPRKASDPRPWVYRGAHGALTRFSASACHARLPLPLPSGTVLEDVTTGRRGLFAGLPAPELNLGDRFVLVDRGGPEPLIISRNLLRVAPQDGKSAAEIVGLNQGRAAEDTAYQESLMDEYWRGL